MKIYFILNQGRKIQDYSKPQKIFLRIRRGRNFEFRKYIGHEIMTSEDKKKSDWDYKEQRAKNRKSITAKDDLNKLLDGLETSFKEFEVKMRSEKIVPSKDDFKKHYKSYFKNNTEVEEETDFIKYIDDYIKYCEDNNTRAVGTIRNYRKVRGVLDKFRKDKFYKLTFERINMRFYNSFNEWSETQEYSNNYRGDIIKNVKLFLRNAYDDKLTTNDIFRNKKFKTIREDADDTYLDKEELKKIYDLNLENHKGLEVVRDLFLIGCYTGLRVSDWESVNSKNIIEKDGFKYLEIMIKKTKRMAKIPVYQDCLNILKKYDFKPPKRSAPYISREIKKVCKKAGINQVIELSKPDGEKRKVVRGEKYQFISSHTARRTLCTLLHKEGVPSIDIMQISGHKTESSFLKYIKVTRSETAERLAKIDFFKTNTLKAV